MSSQSSKQLFLSKHARERLIERSTLTECNLLELLQNNAYRRIHTKWTPDIHQNEIDQYLKDYGFTFEEMKQHGMLRFRVAFKHLMVWSCTDERPLTLIVEPNSGTIITVLNSDDFSSNDWSNKVTEESILDVKEKAERLRISVFNVYELQVRWIDEIGKPKLKTFSNPKIESITPLIPPLEELEVVARSHVAIGRDVWLIVRNRKDHSDIVLEKLLDDTRLWI